MVFLLRRPNLLFLFSINFSINAELFCVAVVKEVKWLKMFVGLHVHIMSLFSISNIFLVHVNGEMFTKCIFLSFCLRTDESHFVSSD